MPENFPNIGKKIVHQVQEAQRVPGRINLRGNNPRHIVTKLTKIKDKDKVLKTTGENDNTQGNSHQADISTETLQARGNGTIYLK